MHILVTSYISSTYVNNCSSSKHTSDSLISLHMSEIRKCQTKCPYNTYWLILNQKHAEKKLCLNLFRVFLNIEVV